MKFQKLRLWLAALILLIGLVVLLVSTWPQPRWQQVVPLPPVRLSAPTPSSLILKGGMG